MSTLPNRSHPADSNHVPLGPSERQCAVLMCAVATTLAAMSFLHLSDILAGGAKPFDRSDAGIAEAVICLVLAYGAAALLRNGPGGRPVAIAATGFAVVGFMVGLRFTLASGSAIDIAYHLASLPILLLTLISLARGRGTRGVEARS